MPGTDETGHREVQKDADGNEGARHSDLQCKESWAGVNHEGMDVDEVFVAEDTRHLMTGEAQGCAKGVYAVSRDDELAEYTTSNDFVERFDMGSLPCAEKTEPTVSNDGRRDG
eukprot:CAMPEP_0170572640 /NCGR_PEP_ID=MMETSP0224-20130122/2325_1 /TAXON_ID=285029 /ORGANISM="Togula jolla, Strain CCCM 725" /LENGTH=112 /DNA_ID=CAMNT_0010895145 /DNA_START=1679 /DNA_END=2015 /DNA_ORIENTATION=-